MEKEKRRALGHKAMNLFQIEMFRIDQDSELFETSPKESPGAGTRKAKIFVNEENLLYRIRQFGEDDVRSGRTFYGWRKRTRAMDLPKQLLVSRAAQVQKNVLLQE